MFQKRWNIATRINAVLKSTKNREIGRKIVEEPKPAMVPTISERKAAIKNRISVNSNNWLVNYSKINYVMIQR